MLLVKPYGLTVSSSDALVSCPASPLGTPCKRFIFTIRDSFWNIVRFHYFQGFGSPLLAKPLFTVSILPLFHRSAHFGACGCDGLRRSTLRSGFRVSVCHSGLNGLHPIHTVWMLGLLCPHSVLWGFKLGWWPSALPPAQLQSPASKDFDTQHPLSVVAPWRLVFFDSPAFSSVGIPHPTHLILKMSSFATRTA